MPTAPPVPSLDDLDAPTVHRLLQDAAGPGPGHQASDAGTADSDATVVAVRAEPLGGATGFLGELRRLHLTYEPPCADSAATPATVVAKAPTGDPGGRRVGLMLNVWAREHRFFTDLAPSCPTRVPRCHAALADDDAARWLLLLGDAGDTTAPPQATGAGRDVAGAALEEIATLHRAFAGRRPAAWLPGFDRGPLDVLQTAVCDAVEPFLARFGDGLPTGGADLLRRFAPRLAAWSAAMATGPLGVVHADYRLDNLVVDPAGRVTVLDWQTALIGHPAMDVASFLVTSLTVHDRRVWEDDLLAAYARAAGLGIDELRLGMRQHLLWWCALYANNLSRLERDDPAAEAMMATTVERTFTAAADHDAARLLDGGH